MPPRTVLRVSPWFLVATLALALGVAGALVPSPSPILAQSSKAVSWDRFDVTVDVQLNGVYKVAEEQAIAFRGGPFRGGTASIPLERIDAIDNVAVAQQDASGAFVPFRRVSWTSFDDAPNTFATQTTNSQVDIAWGFSAASNTTRTFRLTYDVAGALRSYPDATTPNQQIWWTAIAKDTTDVGPIASSTVTINLPQAVDPAQTRTGEALDQDASTYSSDGRSFVFHAANLGQGDDFVVRLAIPPVIDAPVPSWQAADDAKRAQAQQQADRNDLLNVIFLAAGLGIAALGGLALYGLWLLRGRDPHVGLIAEFLPQPPDDLPPGPAGALIDEHAGSREIVGTLVELGQRGVVNIAESSQQTDGGRDYTITLLDPAATLAPFEQSLLRSIFPGDLTKNATAQLSKVKPRFDSAASTVANQIYDELVRRGYFPVSPEQTRLRWHAAGRTLLIAVAVVAVAGGFWIGGRAGFFWFAVLMAGVIALALVRLSGALPRKTQQGAEAAAKWRAFRTYLKDIDKYEHVAGSKAIFDRYFSYAIAFGLAESWVGQFEGVHAEPPAWFGPLGDSFGGGWVGSAGGRRQRGGTIILGGDPFGGFGGLGGGGGSGGGGGGGGGGGSRGFH